MFSLVWTEWPADRGFASSLTVRATERTTVKVTELSVVIPTWHISSNGVTSAWCSLDFNLQKGFTTSESFLGERTSQELGRVAPFCWIFTILLILHLVATDSRLVLNFSHVPRSSLHMKSALCRSIHALNLLLWVYSSEFASDGRQGIMQLRIF